MGDLSERIAALSPEKQALLLDQLKRRRGRAPVTVAAVTGTAAVFPLSPAQQRLWLLEQLEPGTSLYNLPIYVRLKGALQVDVLTEALNEIVRRHGVLRTTFRSGEKGEQVVHPSLKLTVPEIDLRTLAAREREDEVRRQVAEFGKAPFDLANGPLLRVRVLQLADDDWVLAMAIHHLVFDGWSLGILVDELTLLYGAFSQGQPSPLPDLPIQYADYAVWLKNWLQGERLEKQTAYWTRQLEGAPTQLELPLDRPRPPVVTSNGATHRVTLSSELLSSLNALSKELGATLFMTLLAAYQLLLHRHSGQADIVVGSPIANRSRQDCEPLIGFFVNTLVLRSQLPDNPTFKEFLLRVRETALEAYAHQDLPFETLVDVLQPDRDLSATPIYQVVFALQNTPMSRVDFEHLSLELLDADQVFVRRDLTLTAHETPNGLVCNWQYNTDLFDAATIARLANHYQNLLTASVADPLQRTAGLPLFSPHEYARIIEHWNQTRRPYPAHVCFHEAFSQQAAASPQAVALVYQDQHLTYRELDRRSNQLANYLLRFGVGPEVCVGLCIERSPEMLIGLLGILKAGGAYLPLDPAYPLDRLQYMIEDARVSLVLTHTRLLPNFENGASGSSPRFMCLDRDWTEVASTPDSAPATWVRPENLIYIIYTSGSTGKPKGTLINHHGVTNVGRANIDTLGIHHTSRVLQFASLSFDGSVSEISLALMNGGTLVLDERDRVFSPEGLSDLLTDQAITFAKLPPPVVASLPVAPLPHLQALMVGGQSCPGALVEPWARGRRFLHVYGPTETTAYATFAECAGPYRQSPPIGRPIYNMDAYILDRHLQPVPIGTAGELCIGAVGIARGYLHRPELTAEKFIPHPFTAEPGARLYRTGDLARYLPDGNIEFLGRIDHQVKIRGFRVELDEIESVLVQHRDVREAIVVALDIEGTAGNKRLVAYVTPANGDVVSLSTHELRAHLQAQLPDYMVPGIFVPLADLPLSPQGKVNRAALPAPDLDRPELSESFVAPRSAIEAALSKIWAQVLGVRQPGIHDNFFELGGDSILSLQIVSRAHEVGLGMTPRHIFQHQTIAELASAIQALLPTTVDQSAVTGEAPLIPVQRRFFEQDLPAPHHWNQALVFVLKQAPDEHVLRRAIEELHKHHDALRARFRPTGSGWVQTYADAASPVDAFAMLVLPESATPAQDLSRACAEIQATLHLENGPLMRAVLFKFGASYRLLVTIHHLVVDGVSWRVLLEDLQTLYEQLSRGETAALPAKTSSYKRWAELLHAYARSDAVKTEASYWLGMREDAPLPRDFAPTVGDNLERDARTVSVSLSAEETQALLTEVPAVYHTQINDVLLTALAQAFSAWTGRHRLLVDLEGQGREDLTGEVDVSRTVGWFTTVFPVLLDLDGQTRPGAALQAVKEQLRAVPNRGIGYGLLRYLSTDDAVSARLAALPDAEVSFNYLGRFDQAEGDLVLFAVDDDVDLSSHLHGPDGQRRHLISVNGLAAGGQMQFAFTYSQRVHRSATVDTLARNFIAALQALIAHCLHSETAGFTASDFAEFEWDQSDLDEMMRRIGEISGES